MRLGDDGKGELIIGKKEKRRGRIVKRVTYIHIQPFGQG